MDVWVGIVCASVIISFVQWLVHGAWYDELDVMLMMIPFWFVGFSAIVFGIPYLSGV